MDYLNELLLKLEFIEERLFPKSQKRSDQLQDLFQQKFGVTAPCQLRPSSMVRIADSLQNAHVNAFAGISFADRNVYFAEKSIAERSALPIPHSPVCVSNLLHMFAMSASGGEAVSVIAPTMLPHRHMLLL